MTSKSTFAAARHKAASRRRFLFWGAFGAAAACIAPVLTGCSGGTKHGEPDSTYIGSYRAAYTIPSANENGTFAYSVARSGDIIGSFVDSSTNVTRPFSGHLKNDGLFSGTTMDGNNSYPTSGTVSPVVSSSTGGNFNQMRNGTLFAGSFSFVTSGVTPPTDSTYAGAYSGSFNVSGQTAGPASYSIDKQGGVTGFVTSNGETGTLRGQVSNTGAFSGVVTYPSGQGTLTGALAASGTPGLPAGNIVQTKGGVSAPGSFGAPIPLPANSPFLGAYRGTYGVPDSNEAGDLSFTVDPSGAIGGSFNQNNNAPAGVFAGSIAGDGNFVGTVTYPTLPASTSGDPTTAVRTIAGKVAAGTGSAVGKLQGDFRVQYVSAGQSVGPNRPGSLDVTLGAASNVDSIFRGSYANAFHLPISPIAANPNATPPQAAVDGYEGLIPFGVSAAPFGTVPQAAGFSFSVDKQGKLVGSVSDQSSGVVSTLTGSVTNDGRFTAVLATPTGSYPLVGKLSKQGVLTKDATAATPKNGFSPGVSANFQVKVNGTDYPGFFFAPGGFTGN